MPKEYLQKYRNTLLYVLERSPEAFRKHEDWQIKRRRQVVNRFFRRIGSTWRSSEFCR